MLLAQLWAVSMRVKCASHTSTRSPLMRISPRAPSARAELNQAACQQVQPFILGRRAATAARSAVRLSQSSALCWASAVQCWVRELPMAPPGKLPFVKEAKVETDTLWAVASVLSRMPWHIVVLSDIATSRHQRLWRGIFGCFCFGWLSSPWSLADRSPRATGASIGLQVLCPAGHRTQSNSLESGCIRSASLSPPPPSTRCARS